MLVIFEFFVASIFESFDSQSDDGIFPGYLSVEESILMKLAFLVQQIL